MSETSFDSKRRLCPDGSCIGVIRADGRCGECGRAADGKPKLVEKAVDKPVDGAVDEAVDGAMDDEQRAADTFSAGDDSAPTGDAGFNPNRRLCDDGSCVGIVGADGRCGVCGLKAT